MTVEYSARRAVNGERLRRGGQHRGDPLGGAWRARGRFLLGQRVPQAADEAEGSLETTLLA